MIPKKIAAVFCWPLLSAAVVTGGEAETLTLRMAKIGGWVMAKDGITLIVSQPTRQQLVFIDTATGKELRRVQVGFQPACLAMRGDTLFASASASSIVYALDVASGRELRRVKLPGEPIRSLACHPTHGPIFAANLNEEVLIIDPANGSVASGKASGMFLAVDSRKGEFLYTGTNRPGVNEFIEVTRGPGDTARLRFVTERETAALRKYAVKGQTLQLVAGNANAAYGAGGALHVSPDGQKIALAARGGWYPSKADRPRPVIAVFSTEDLTTTLGQVDSGSQPENIAFHPSLDLGVALSDGSNLTFFKADALIKRSTMRIKRLPYANRHDMLTFGGKGKTVVFLQGENLQIVPLEGSASEGAAASSSPPSAQKKATAENKPSGQKAAAQPVAIKDKKSIWFLETAVPEAQYISDRDYAITKLPKELKNATMIVRTSGDVGDDFLSIGKIAALDDCTMYAAIQWDPTAKQGVSKNDFRRLIAAGWKEMPGTFETSGVGENVEWKVLSKPLEQGSVSVDLRLPKFPRTHIVFLFQPTADGDGKGASSTDKPAAGGKAKSDKPAASPVAIKNKKSVWFLETAAAEALYISDRDYAIAKLPKELKNATMIVRTSEDVGEGSLPIGRITATADCTMYVAIQWDPTAKQGVSKNDFRRLSAAGWKEVPGTFETTGASENMEWKVLSRPLEEGSVSVELRLPQPKHHVVFLFK